MVLRIYGDMTYSDMGKRHSITNEQWTVIEPLLPKSKYYAGRPCFDRRSLVDAMLWIFKTGAPWRDLPSSHGNWKTVYNNFLRWRDAGVWEKILQQINSETEVPWQIMIDSTSVKAHQHSGGAKKGLEITLSVVPEAE